MPTTGFATPQQPAPSAAPPQERQKRAAMDRRQASVVRLARQVNPAREARFAPKRENVQSATSAPSSTASPFVRQGQGAAQRRGFDKGPMHFEGSHSLAMSIWWNIRGCFWYILPDNWLVYL